jgi:2-polyprenyl-3-methyl-5-hydroxy-6-metoxy-1,4-benzoquinol methylase
LRWASKNSGVNLLDGKGKRALDVGCALGYTSEVLTMLGYETSAFDISTYAAKQAKQEGKADFLVCDAQANLPFREATFDLVTCFDVLEHLPCPEKALKSMLNVCKNTVVCTTPNRKVEKTVRKIMGDYDETHINTKSPAEWQKIMAAELVFSAARVEAFHDFAGGFLGKQFFKSISIPNYGLTLRIMIKK